MKGTAYLFQASIIIAWWVLISFNEDAYQYFSYSKISRDSFFTLLVPDVLLIGALSLARAYFNRKDLGFIILGAFSYATLFCISATITGKDGFAPSLIMVFGLVFNLYLCYPDFFIRSSVSSSKLINALKTAIQIFCFWILFLGLIPFLLMYSLGEEINNPALSTQYYIGIFFFLLSSLLGLSSAYFMVVDGNGTPLPLDATNALVVRGPYSFVRNPMAVAGVGQLIGISIAFSALPIVVYALIGGFAWHIIVRPHEEKDLEEKFGRPYREYRKSVRCWFPGSPRDV